MTIWLWGDSEKQAMLKVQSRFVSIHLPPDMLSVAAGTFQQGDVEKLGESWRNPVRWVTIKRFAMGKYEVTFEEYERFAIATGRRLPDDQKWGRGKQPVMNVLWEDAQAYAKWLSHETQKPYRLPTESEWEYAARSGTKQEVWAGTTEESELGNYAVFSKDSRDRRDRTAAVGKKMPNSFGLYDLSGNVWEWVEDCWYDTYTDAPKDGSAWSKANSGGCGDHVIRGGSWYNGPGPLRASKRDMYTPGHVENGLGFRLAQDLEP